MLTRTTLTPQIVEDCFAISASSDGKAIAVANGECDIWDLSTSKANIRERSLPVFGNPDERYVAVAWHPNGKLLAAADTGGRLDVWTTDQWHIVFTKEFGSGVSELRWNPKANETLAVATEDEFVTLLDLKLGAAPVRLAPTFVVEEYLTKGDEFLADEDWYALGILMPLLDGHRLSASEKASLEKLQFNIHQKLSDFLDGVVADIGENGMDENAMLDLQDIIDAASRSPAADTARKLLRGERDPRR